MVIQKFINKKYYKKYNILKLAVQSKDEYYEKTMIVLIKLVFQKIKNLIKEFSLALMQRKF